MNLKNGEIIYSYDIAKKVAVFLNSKKNKIQVKSFLVINNEIFVFLKNSYLLKFKLNGEINEVIKLPTSLNTSPIVIDDYLLYLDNNNKLIIIN